MLNEKKSFRRFLLIYISSSLLLLSIGTFLYYKMSYQLIITNNTTKIKENIDTFIQKNKTSGFLFSGVTPKYDNIPLAIYINKELKIGSFEPKNIDLSKEFFIDNDRLYYLLKEHKMWGDILFLSYIDISKEHKELLLSIVIFSILSTLFIIFISFVLGRAFLRPMKETIESLEDFISDATHEINTPLSNILINIELAQEIYPLCKESEEFKKIESSAFRISKLFQDLTYVRLEHQKRIDIESVALKKLIEERVEFFATFIKNKSLHLKLNLKERELKASKEDIIRLIDNLLSNAIKYSPQGATLEIKLQNSLEIINEGAIKDSSQIVKKFVRENKSEGGFGLGLYIVKKICTSYNYKFTISSSNNRVTSCIFFSTNN